MIKTFEYDFVKYLKNQKIFLIENIIETNHDSDDEKPPFHSEDGKPKYLQQT